MSLIRIIVFFMLLVGCINAGAKHNATSYDVAGLYNSIGHKLAEVKKIAPACAHKISCVSDDVDKLYGVAKTSQNQDQAAMKELETRTIESAVLQKELLIAKQESELLKQSLQTAQLQLEKEQAQAAILREQNKQLVQKNSSQNDLISAEISKLDKQLATEGANIAGGAKKEPASLPAETKKVALLQRSNFRQNLNLTSTSDPSSPR